MVFILLIFTNHSQEKQNFYEMLFYEYKATMYWAAFQILNDQQLAEDAVQQTFERMIKYKVEEKIIDPVCNKTRSFLVTIVRNVSYGMLEIINKSKNVILLEEIVLVSDQPSPLDFVLSEEFVEEIKEAIKKLNPIYAEVLILSQVHRCTDQEIAGLLKISHSNVRVRIHRAKKMLSELITKEGLSDDIR